MRRTSTDERSRLSLWLRPVGAGGYDFDHLSWEHLGGASWTSVLTISREAFQSGFERGRWLSDIYSFDSISGHAILLVAETSQPLSHASSRVIYSWRRWDLRANAELALLQVCDGPFQPYAPTQSNG